MCDLDDLDSDFITYDPALASLISSVKSLSVGNIVSDSIKDLSVMLNESNKNQRINFRIDAELKRQFEQLCVDNHTTVSAALKRMMLLSVKGKVLP